MKRGSARYPCPWCFWLLMVSLHIVILTACRSTTQENEQTASSGGLVPDLCTLLPFRPQMQLHATCTVIEWERGTETTWTSDHTVCQSTEVQFDFVVGPMKLPQLARNGPLYVSCLRFTKLTCFLYSLQTHLLTNWRAPIKRWRWHDWRRQHTLHVGVFQGTAKGCSAIRLQCFQWGISEQIWYDIGHIYVTFVSRGLVTVVGGRSILFLVRFWRPGLGSVHHLLGEGHGPRKTEARQAEMTQDEMEFHLV